MYHDFLQSTAIMDIAPENISLDWEKHQNEILDLFITQNKPLHEVVKHMSDKHGFVATERQYKHRFPGLKNVKEDEWRFIASEFDRRTAAGQQSMACLHNRPLPPSRVARGLLRVQGTSHRITKTVHTSRRVSVRTPPPTCPNDEQSAINTTLTLAGILDGPEPPSSHSHNEPQRMETAGADYVAGFEMDMSCVSSTFSERRLCSGSAALAMSASPIFNQEPPPLTPSILFESIEFPQLSVMENIPWFNLLSIMEQPEFRVRRCFNSLNWLNDRNLAPWATASPGLLALEMTPLPVASFPDPWPDSGTEETFEVDGIGSYLEALIPERHHGELAHRLQQGGDPSLRGTTLETLLWRFAVTAFLASNNLLEDSRMDELLQWVVQSKYTSEALVQFTRNIQTPTIDSFATALVKSAIRIRSVGILELLLLHGVNLDSVIDQIAMLRSIPGHLAQRLMDAADPEYLTKAVGTKLFQYLTLNHHYAQAKFLLQNGVHVDVEVGSRTALMSAVQRNDVDTVSFLLDHHADVNRLSSYGGVEKITVLQLAIRSKLADMTRILLDRGASINMVVIDGQCAMDWASVHCRSVYGLLKTRRTPGDLSLAPGDIVEVARRGDSAFQAFIHAQLNRLSDNLLEKALEGAIKAGHFTAVATLLNHGVNPNAPSLSKGPLETALSNLQNGKMDIVELLIGFKSTVLYPRILIDLIWKRAKLSIFSQVVELGINNEELQHALSYAVARDDIVYAEVIIQCGVDINGPGTKAGYLNAIQAAAFEAQEDTVLYLLDKGANINAPAYHNGGLTALQAALTGEAPVGMLKLLLRLGADASAPPALIDGTTALEAYCLNYRGRTSLEADFCFELLNAGATVNRPGMRPSSAIHGVITQGSGWNHILAHFLEPQHNAITNHVWTWASEEETWDGGEELLTPTQRAANVGNLGALEMLLKHGTDVNEPAACRFGRTALQAVAAQQPGLSKMKLIHFLLNNGADIHARPALTFGFTALQGAAIAGDLKLAELFLSRGADVNAAPSFKEGRYAIEGAAEHGRLDMVQLLLNAGAKGNILRGTGLTKAIRLAERNDHFAIANLLKGEARRWEDDHVSGAFDFSFAGSSGGAVQD
ncbi:ankyrin repeat-containing domain protein [Cladorrhinum sp. PSN259]|nr:ankyrin repeat-containing domain protein [Cladorrhinum sp. PSN259]